MEANYQNHKVYDLVVVSDHEDFDENGNPIPAKLYMRADSISSPWQFVMELKGYEGVGIDKIEGPATPGVPGATDIYTIYLTDLTNYSFKVYNGIDGYTPQKGVDYTDGISPTIETAPTENGYEMTITDVNGTNTIELTKGVSPTINTEPIENGHKVTITDVNGTEEIELTNGENGKIHYRIWTAADLNI